jgi:hypothetical protein
MRWMGCVARVEELRKMYKILAAIMCGRDHFVELILGVKIILKLILKRKIVACELNSSHSGRRREEA